MTRHGLDAPAVLADGAWKVRRMVWRWVSRSHQVDKHADKSHVSKRGDGDPLSTTDRAAHAAAMTTKRGT